METARPSYKADTEARCRERVVRLEARDRERAAHLLRLQAALSRAEKREAELQRKLADSEKNAAAFHAQLLQERVRKIPDRDRG